MDFILERGDPDHLQGKVVVYARQPLSRGFVTHAMFATHDKDAFGEMLSALSHEQNTIDYLTDLQTNQEVLLQRFKEGKIKVDGKELFMLPCYNYTTEIEKEDLPKFKPMLSGKEDRIFAGEHQKPDLIARAINSTRRLYFDLLQQQFIIQRGTFAHFVNPVPYLQQHYIAPLLKAAETKDAKAFYDLKIRCALFFYKQVPEGVEDAAREFLTSVTPRRADAVSHFRSQLRLEMLIALIEGRLEAAASLKEKIQKLQSAS